VKESGKSDKKGTFGALRLPVARSYVRLRSKKKMLVIGAVASATFIAYYLVTTLAGAGQFASGGPLSSAHATFGAKCERCHATFREVASEKCSLCHEKIGDEIGSYSLARHYIFRSRDPERSRTGAARTAAKETACSSCHPEHGGRDAAITDVPDRRCTGCHDYGSFNRDHPDFEFRRAAVRDDSALAFAHVHHTKFVLDKLGSMQIERACLQCHVPAANGAHFQPIEYDRHCAQCHLTSEQATPFLPIADSGAPDAPGVETLETIQSAGGPATLWAYTTNPNAFAVNRNRGTVRKQPLEHRDPWVLHNLAGIRRSLHSELGLADLLDTYGLASNENASTLFAEALDRLQRYATPLRGRPEPDLQNDLEVIDSLLASAGRMLAASSYASVDSVFLAPYRTENAALSSDARGKLEDLALKLTRACRLCHRLANASIARVQKDQQVLVRARFDHRAHLLDRGCLDCHNAIAVTPEMVAVAPGGVPDSAFVQNIPGIENCRECHSPRGASNACATCHLFHPDKSLKSNLLLTSQ